MRMLVPVCARTHGPVLVRVHVCVYVHARTQQVLGIFVGTGALQYGPVLSCSMSKVRIEGTDSDVIDGASIAETLVTKARRLTPPITIIITTGFVGNPSS